MIPLFHAWNRALRAVPITIVLAAAGLASGCFDAEDDTEGLRCTLSSHCGGSLECIAGVCGKPGECDTTPDACPQNVSVSVGQSSMTASDATQTAGDDASVSGSADDGPSCALQGQACDSLPCCDGLPCADFGNGVMTCQPACTVGPDCDSCCCVQLADGFTRACVDLSYCGQEATCPGPGSGCGSPGAACNVDLDCCNGGRCTTNAGGWNSCFKTCFGPGDCVSGCCNYRSDLGTSICESTCA